MSVNEQNHEQDLEQLELYLDNELSADQAGAIEVRCLAEPELGTTLARLREDRAARLTAMSSSFDTDAASIERLVASVRMAQASEALQLKRKATGWLPTRSVLAAAASLAFGLFLGVTLQKQHGSVTAAPAVSTNNLGAMWGSPVNLTNDSLQGHGTYVVALKDTDGSELMKLRFNTREEAQQFVNRVNNRGTNPVPMHIGDARILDEPY